VYVEAGGAVKAVPFDAKRWRVTGTPVTVIERVQGAVGGGAPVALSPEGTLVYLSGLRLMQPVLLDRRGGRRPLPVEAQALANPRYSPDGRRIAFGGGAGSGMRVYDLEAGTLSPLTTDASDTRPEWTPDGGRVLFVRTTRAGESTLWWQPADGSGPASRLYSTPDQTLEGVLTPDGRTLVYRTGPGSGSRDILAVPLVGDRTPRPVVTGPATEMMPRLSPDGRWLAYMSDESGAMQVYVRPFPGPGGRTQVSVDGGTEPVWTRDGRHLFFRSGRRLIDAAVRTAPTFAVLGREPFLEGDFETSASHPNYDVAPDGAQVLLLEPAGGRQQVVVVHGWLRELLAATDAR
jgi:Tol biopolymer transport system component